MGSLATEHIRRKRGAPVGEHITWAVETWKDGEPAEPQRERALQAHHPR